MNRNDPRPIPYAWAAGPAEPDDVDAAVVRQVTAHPAAALWRVWRHPAVPTPWPPPQRLILAQVPDDPAVIAAVLRQAVTATGESDPLVEVFTDPAELPDADRQALAHATLLWAAEPAAPLRIVPTFDLVDDDGRPAFADDRPVLEPAEADRVAAYLAAGAPLLCTAELVADVFDPGGEPVVPMGIRGDGHRLWSESVTYYTERHGIAPDADLLAAVRAADYTCPAVSLAAIHRAVRLILDTVHAAEEEPDQW